MLTQTLLWQQHEKKQLEPSEVLEKQQVTCCWPGLHAPENITQQKFPWGKCPCFITFPGFSQSRIPSSGIEFLTGFCLPKSICLFLNLIQSPMPPAERKILDVTECLGQLLQCTQQGRCRRRSIQRRPWRCLLLIPGLLLPVSQVSS